MKVETPVKLSQELPDAIERLSATRGDPPEFLECAACQAIEAAEVPGNWLSFGDDFEESDFSPPHSPASSRSCCSAASR
jgi:hypothetical protein